MGKLEGRVAVITGAANGLGEEMARLFAEEGARVVVADVLEEPGRAVASSLGAAARFHRLDVADEAQWQALVADAVAAWGAVDILVNNAGIVTFGSVLNITPEQWRRALDVNLTGAWLGIRAAGAEMVKRGRGAIVNISSMFGLIGANGVSPYHASKWGLRGLSRGAAMELGHRGVRVNTLFPGTMRTALSDVRKSPGDAGARFRRVPLGRIGEPSEVARATLFLVSDEASYIHGAELAVDGGATIGFYVEDFPGAPPPLAQR